MTTHDRDNESLKQIVDELREENRNLKNKILTHETLLQQHIQQLNGKYSNLKNAYFSYFFLFFSYRMINESSYWTNLIT